MFEIKKLSVCADNKDILKDLDLKINKNEIHAIMGPNGAGKSTLCKAILNSDIYEKNGEILFDNENITNSDTSDIAKKGIFLLSQNPIEIEGVTNAQMLRTVLNSNDKKMNIFKFSKKAKQICNELNIEEEFLHREINLGMSGGEKKKNEMIHMWMLEPKLLLLDEIDSGLDVDALKIVSESITKYFEKFNCSILIITHYKKILDYLKPDFVHILKDKKIVKSGKYDLAEFVETNGFENL